MEGPIGCLRESILAAESETVGLGGQAPGPGGMIFLDLRDLGPWSVIFYPNSRVAGGYRSSECVVNVTGTVKAGKRAMPIQHGYRQWVKGAQGNPQHRHRPSIY